MPQAPQATAGDKLAGLPLQSKWCHRLKGPTTGAGHQSGGLSRALAKGNKPRTSGRQAEIKGVDTHVTSGSRMSIEVTKWHTR